VSEHVRPTNARPKREVGRAHAAEQPFEYPLKREYVEPDWTRLSGFADVTTEQWGSAQWQRAHSMLCPATWKSWMNGVSG